MDEYSFAPSLSRESHWHCHLHLIKVSEYKKCLLEPFSEKWGNGEPNSSVKLIEMRDILKVGGVHEHA